MDLVFKFLRDIARHNDREWMQDHRQEYEQARAIFETMVEKLIVRISSFDASVSHLSVKECTYRFNRDTRFSPDKSPYKRHFGAYIAAHGKKAYHGGYYLHIQPGECMVAGGAYCLPPAMLKAVRQSVVDDIDEFRGIVESPEFARLFMEGRGKGIGLERVRTVPKGFASDFPYLDYIRPKDYSIATCVDDAFLCGDDWLDRTEHIFRVMKPFIDFVNYTIDDYE